MALGKILMIAGIVVVAIGAGIGGTLGVTALMPHHTASAAKLPPAIKTLFFASLTDVIVSIPADAGAPPSSFVQFAVNFSTYDQNAITAFAEVQPIIKSDVISLLMNETGKTLQDPATRNDLSKSCLAIANTVLSRSASFTPMNPFTAAYITNLVVQN